MTEKSWPVWDVDFSPDGHWIAAGRGYRDNAQFWPEGGDGKVNVWSVEGWKQQDGFSAPFTHLAGSIAFTPDNKCLIAAANQFIRVKPDRRVGQWSMLGNIAAGAPNPWDGNIIFIWTVSDGKLVRSIHINKDNGRVNSLAVGVDSKLIALGREKSILMLQRKDGRLAYEVEADHSTSMAFSPDNKTFASAARYELKVQLYDVATGQKLIDFNQPGKGLSSTSVHFSLDGKQIAVDVLDGSVRLLATDLSKQLRSLEVSAYKEEVVSLAYAAKANLLAAATPTKVRLFEPSSGKQLRGWRKAELGVSSVALSPDGKLLAVGYGGVYMHGVKGYPRSGYVNIWDTATGKLVKKLD